MPITNGETITLHHDCSLPRPYSRDYVVQGTKGMYEEDKGFYLDTPEFKEKYGSHNWAPVDEIRAEYEHPIWKEYEQESVNHGHGGMDYLVLSAFAEAVINDVKPPIDVYDTATWMVVTCLSEQSCAMGGMPVPIPDFTNGAWIDREPYRKGKFCLEEVCVEE
jgi:hypothetical protein